MQTHLSIGMFSIFCVFFVPRPVLAVSINGGTAIVGILTLDEIVLAADSKALQLYSTEKKNIPTSRSTCKIFQISNNMFYSAAGPTLVEATKPEERPYAYVVEAIIAQAFKRSGNPAGTIKIAEDEIRQSLQSSLQHSKREESNEYKKYFASMSRIEVIFASARAGSLFVNNRIFQAIDAANSVYVTTDAENFVCPLDCKQDRIRYWTFGNLRETMRKYLSQEASWENGALKAAEHAIELAIKSDPKTIGPPVDTVRISQVGIPSTRIKKQCVKS